MPKRLVKISKFNSIDYPTVNKYNTGQVEAFYKALMLWHEKYQDTIFLCEETTDETVKQEPLFWVDDCEATIALRIIYDTHTTINLEPNRLSLRSPLVVPLTPAEIIACRLNGKSTNKTEFA